MRYEYWKVQRGEFRGERRVERGESLALTETKF